MTQAADALASPTLNLRRIFNAPRELVWRAWTRPDIVVAWLGPPEWPAVQVEQDLRPGGVWRACLRSAKEDRLLWQGGVYREVAPPERLVFSFKWESSEHEDGDPVDTLVTVLFTEIPGGRTQMDFTQRGLKSEQSLAGHRHGWTGTFSRLEQWLHTYGRTA